MKKILLSAAVLLTAGALNAQILSANDLSGFSTFSVLSLDADTLNWSVVDLTGAGTALDAAGECMLSNSWTGANGALSPDNLFISPAMDCSTETSVTASWSAGSNESTVSTYYEENYAVYVVTDLVALAAGTFPAAVFETILVGGEELFNENVDISSIAAGQAAVYIVFRHYNCTDMNYMILDDIMVSGGTFTGVAESSIEANVYPNPASTVLNVKTTGVANSVSILSMDGKIISNTVMNGTSTTVDVAILTAGVYFYEIVAADGSVVRNTFVKK